MIVILLKEVGDLNILELNIEEDSSINNADMAPGERRPMFTTVGPFFNPVGNGAPMVGIA